MILDTNALSAIADGVPSAVEAFSRASRPALPVVTLGEFRFGIMGSRKRVRYEKWLGEMTAALAVLNVDKKTASLYAAIRDELKRAGTPIPSNDVWIAALCRQHQVAVLSRDGHFDHVEGAERISW